ncbi:unnamed protein product [Owenia fusiformis]|uniref:Ubiquitin-like domain-containing protein n=1 Tax=Owenia fusiformis TaxID=6347 RepID=A0A8S4N280_OWEFU|nr:unnamed protein product [Owenia fusiformis]
MNLTSAVYSRIILNLLKVKVWISQVVQAMSLIEGIGDEVLVLFAVLSVLLLAIVAWVSTSVADLPFVSVIIFERRQAQQTDDTTEQVNEENLNTETVGTENNVTENDATDNHEEVAQDVEEEVNHANGSVEHEIIDGSNIEDVKFEKESNSEDINIDNDSNIEDNESNIESCEIAEPPQNESELRQRRVEFFSQNASASIQSPTLAPQADKTEAESTQNKQDRQNVTPTTIAAPTSENSERTASSINNENASFEDGIPEGHIKVRIKYLDERQRQVFAKPETTIQNFRRDHFPGELAENKLVRFIFNGQELRNDLATLEAYNIQDNSAIHCLLSDPQRQNDELVYQDQAEIDLSALMLPLFGVILGLVWYCRVMYRNYFNATSTLALGGISMLYAFALASTFRTLRQHEPPHVHVHAE